jgi:hypothetical protein
MRDSPRLQLAYILGYVTLRIADAKPKREEEKSPVA